MPLTERQLAVRRTGITATDIRAIVGLDPYGRTPHDVYLDKLGRSQRSNSEPEYLELGQDIEPVVVKHLARRRNLYVVNVLPDHMTRVHPKFPTHIATPDAFLAALPEVPGHFEGANSIGQVKVVGGFMAEDWGKSEEGTIPDWCLVQCMWELHVCELETEHVGALIWPQVRSYTVGRDEDLIGSLIEEADRFMLDHVLAKKPPAPDGSEGASRMVRGLFPKPKGPRFKASAQVEELARAYFDSERDAKHANKVHTEAKQMIALACGEAEGIDGDGWRLNYAWREAVDVKPEPYTRAAYRHWDLRAKGGKR